MLGVLVPASPRAEGETAGFEWYDSGIGFAVPLEDVFAALPRLKQGKDLKRGLLGITLQQKQGQDEHSLPATIATVSPVACSRDTSAALSEGSTSASTLVG